MAPSDAPEAHETTAQTSADKKFPRLKRPDRPDLASLKAEVDGLQEQINEHKRRVEEIGEILSQRRGSRQPGGEQQKLRSRLNDLTGQFKRELGKKQAAKADLEAVTKARDNMRAHMKESKSKLQYATVEQLDQQIARLEAKQAHSSLTPREEQRVLTDITKLRTSRVTIGQFHDDLEKLHSETEEREEIYGQIKASDAKLNELKAAQDSVRAQLEELRQTEQESQSDIPAILQERDTCRDSMRTIYEDIKALRADFNVRMDAFREEDQVWKQQMDEQRKQMAEVRQKEYEERQAARKAQFAETAGDPYWKEIACCDQLLAFLGRYAPAAQEESTSAVSQSVDAPEGMRILKKKGTEEELDSWFGGLGAGKGAKGRGKKSRSSSSDGSKPKDSKINFSPEIYQGFSKVKVEVPLTSSKVPAIIAVLNERKAYYLDKQREAKANGEVAAEDEEPAPAEPVANRHSQPEMNGFSADDFAPALGASNPPKLLPTSTAVAMALTYHDGGENVLVALTVAG